MAVSLVVIGCAEAVVVVVAAVDAVVVAAEVRLQKTNRWRRTVGWCRFLSFPSLSQFALPFPPSLLSLLLFLL